MKITRNIVLGVLGFGAWVVIGMAGDSFRERGDAVTGADLVYLLLLVLAVIYFHWLFRMFVMPLSGLCPSRRAELVASAGKKYDMGFYRGTVGFGYFLLFLYVVGFLIETPRRAKAPDFALGALFFIGLGVLAQVRSLVLALTDRELNERQAGSTIPGPAPGPSGTASNIVSADGSPPR